MGRWSGGPFQADGSRLILPACESDEGRNAKYTSSFADGEAVKKAQGTAVFAYKNGRNKKVTFGEKAGAYQGYYTVYVRQSVPYVVKDFNVWIEGVPATNGSKAFETFLPPHDSELVKRMRAAGLVVGFCNCQSLPSHVHVSSKSVW